MVRSFREIAELAGEKGPMRLAVLAPEDEEFMLAVKMGRQKGYIEPILIGDENGMKRAAEKVDFDVTGCEIIHSRDRQTISNLGVGMVFSGELPIASKGQIPTSYIYRSIIREEANAGSGMNVSVISFWDLPGAGHLVGFTDTGVNIQPDIKAKLKICENALFVFRHLGYSKPRIAVLSGKSPKGDTDIGGEDWQAIRKAADSGDLGECEVIDATSFTGIFAERGRRLEDCKRADMGQMPHILLVPCLDTGNILCKLDLLLEVSRCSLAVTSRGPICIPARSDVADAIVEQLALGVVLADRMNKGK